MTSSIEILNQLMSFPDFRIEDWIQSMSTPDRGQLINDIIDDQSIPHYWHVALSIAKTVTTDEMTDSFFQECTLFTQPMIQQDLAQMTFLISQFSSPQQDAIFSYLSIHPHAPQRPAIDALLIEWQQTYAANTPLEQNNSSWYIQWVLDQCQRFDPSSFPHHASYHWIIQLIALDDWYSHIGPWLINDPSRQWWVQLLICHDAAKLCHLIIDRLQDSIFPQSMFQLITSTPALREFVALNSSFSSDPIKLIHCLHSASVDSLPAPTHAAEFAQFIEFTFHHMSLSHIKHYLLHHSKQVIGVMGILSQYTEKPHCFILIRQLFDIFTDHPALITSLFLKCLAQKTASDIHRLFDETISHPQFLNLDHDQKNQAMAHLMSSLASIIQKKSHILLRDMLLKRLDTYDDQGPIDPTPDMVQHHIKRALAPLLTTSPLIQQLIDVDQTQQFPSQWTVSYQPEDIPLLKHKLRLFARFQPSLFEKLISKSEIHDLIQSFDDSEFKRYITTKHDTQSTLSLADQEDPSKKPIIQQHRDVISLMNPQQKTILTSFKKVLDDCDTEFAIDSFCDALYLHCYPIQFSDTPWNHPWAQFLTKTGSQWIQDHPMTGHSASVTALLELLTVFDNYSIANTWIQQLQDPTLDIASMNQLILTIQSSETSTYTCFVEELLSQCQHLVTQSSTSLWTHPLIQHLLSSLSSSGSQSCLNALYRPDHSDTCQPLYSLLNTQLIQSPPEHYRVFIKGLDILTWCPPHLKTPTGAYPESLIRSLGSTYQARFLNSASPEHLLEQLQDIWTQIPPSILSIRQFLIQHLFERYQTQVDASEFLRSFASFYQSIQCQTNTGDFSLMGTILMTFFESMIHQSRHDFSGEMQPIILTDFQRDHGQLTLLLLKQMDAHPTQASALLGIFQTSIQYCLSQDLPESTNAAHQWATLICSMSPISTRVGDMNGHILTYLNDQKLPIDWFYSTIFSLPTNDPSDKPRQSWIPQSQFTVFLQTMSATKWALLAPIDRSTSNPNYFFSFFDHPSDQIQCLQTASLNTSVSAKEFMYQWVQYFQEHSESLLIGPLSDMIDPWIKCQLIDAIFKSKVQLPKPITDYVIELIDRPDHASILDELLSCIFAVIPKQYTEFIQKMDHHLTPTQSQYLADKLVAHSDTINHLKTWLGWLKNSYPNGPQVVDWPTFWDVDPPYGFTASITPLQLQQCLWALAHMGWYDPHQLSALTQQLGIDLSQQQFKELDWSDACLLMAQFFTHDESLNKRRFHRFFNHLSMDDQQSTSQYLGRVFQGFMCEFGIKNNIRRHIEDLQENPTLMPLNEVFKSIIDPHTFIRACAQKRQQSDEKRWINDLKPVFNELKTTPSQHRIESLLSIIDNSLSSS